METLESRLTWARESAGISQARLSGLAGLSSRLVGMIERGDRPNPGMNTLKAMADVLGVKVGWLVSGDEPAPTVDAIKAAVASAVAKGAAA